MDKEGFYRERALLEEDMRANGDSLSCIDFSFMENIEVFDLFGQACCIPLSSTPLTLNDFLHGFCYVFSLLLHNMFGYKVVNIYGDKHDLIHSFCVTSDGEFVDVRGKTSDAYEFFSDFEDWIYVADWEDYASDNAVPKLLTLGEELLYQAAEYILHDYHEYYST